MAAGNRYGASVPRPAASRARWTRSPATRQVVASATTTAGRSPKTRPKTSTTAPSAPGPMMTCSVSVASASAASIRPSGIGVSADVPGDLVHDVLHLRIELGVAVHVEAVPLVAVRVRVDGALDVD